MHESRFDFVLVQHAIDDSITFIPSGSIWRSSRQMEVFETDSHAILSLSLSLWKLPLTVSVQIQNVQEVTVHSSSFLDHIN